MAAGISLGAAREEFTVETSKWEEASSTEPRPTMDRAASDDLEGMSETQSHQAARRHHGPREQAVHAGDVEVGQPSTTSSARPEPSTAFSKELSTPLSSPGLTGDRDADRILRVHFATPILADLRKIQRHCGTPAAAVYADSILRTIRAMRDLVPFDPYTELAMALYDAMAFQNRWLDYTAEQYEGAHHLLRNLADRSQLRNNDIENAIMDLEDLGFDTTPFEMNVELGNNVDDEG
jgi:hypothetical protein